MINAISGKLKYIIANKAIISTSLGVEFEIIVSSRTASTLLNLSEDDRDNVRLLVNMQHNDEAVMLYGFLTDGEKNLYQELVKINGIGSKQALKILSSLNEEEFYECVNNANVKALANVPGLGLKTAQKILLALKNKLVTIEKPQKSKPNKKVNNFSSISDALQDMGYDTKDINAAIENAKKIVNFDSDNVTKEQEEEIFRTTFQILNKK